MKYVVKNLDNNMYLTDSYYRPNQIYTKSFIEAHKFSAFELLLASKTVLSNRKRYMVYRYDKLLENIDLIEM